MSSFSTRPSTIGIEEEEHELNLLNHRFANYLDKIKDLGTIHLELRREIDSFHQNYLSKTTESKSSYSYAEEFHQLRQQLNLESKNLNHFQIRYEHAEHKKKDYQNQITHLSHDDSLARTQQQFGAYIEELDLLKRHFQTQTRELQFSKNQYNEYLNKLIDYSTELDAINLSRLQSEDDLCTLREQVAFERKYNEIRQQEFQYLDQIQSDFENQYSKNELKGVIEKIREDYREYNEIQLEEYEYLYKAKFEMIEKNFRETKKDDNHSENIQDLIEENRQLQNQLQQHQSNLQQIRNQKQSFHHLTTEVNEYESLVTTSRSSTVHLTSQIKTYQCLLTNLTQKPPMKFHFDNDIIWVRI